MCIRDSREEETIIVPAIEKARGKGADIIGPLPPDTAFTQMRRESVDAYICMYHDQALIPVKALAFDQAVNVTLGLPIVRTSVDHGTALDRLAGKGRPEQPESCGSFGSPDDLKSSSELFASLTHYWVVLFLILPLGSFAQSKALQEKIATWGGKLFSKKVLWSKFILMEQSFFPAN